MTLLTLPETTSRRLTRIYAAGNTTQTYQVTKKKMTMETTNSKTAPIVQEKDQNQMERLLSLDFVRQGQNLFITGSAGTGKSFLATAIGYHACKNGIRTLYSNTSKLLSSLKVAKAKNTIETELKKIERCQLLILDDAFLVPLDAKERPILLEIIEDRHDRKSIVMASQLPVENWYDAIGDQAVADAVLDRIVHSSHRIELFGESIRKMKTKK